MEVLLAQAVRADAAVAREDSEFAVLGRQVAVGGQLLELQGLGGVYSEIFLPLHGEHQAHNAVVALAAVEAFFGAGADRQLDIDAVRAGFAAATSPGRLERMRTAPTVFIDAAHNPAGRRRAGAGARARSSTSASWSGWSSVMADKDVDGILAALEPVFDQIVVTHNGSPRAMDVECTGAARRGAVRAGAGGHRRPHCPTPSRPPPRSSRRPATRAKGSAARGMVITGSVVTAGAARTLFGKDPMTRAASGVSSEAQPQGGECDETAAAPAKAGPVEELPRRHGGHADPGSHRGAAGAAGRRGRRRRVDAV